MQFPYPEPDLTDGVVRLRRWEHRDCDCVRLAASDPRIPEGTSVPPNYSHGAAIAFIERQRSRQAERQGLSLAIEAIAGGDAVGLVVALFREQPAVVGLGYWVVPPARGHGYASSAVRLLARWLLNRTATTRVEALVEPDNLASRRSLELCGFQEEGLLRSYLNGERDALIYSLSGAISRP